MPYVRNKKAVSGRSAVRAATLRAIRAGPRRHQRMLRKRKMPQRNNVSMGLGFPKIVKMTHRYFQNVTLVTTGGIPQFQRFRANGMYDPDQSGIGHQPMFYDQMNVLYNHWKVIGSKITVTFIPTSATTVPQFVGVIADDDTSNSIDINTLNEQSDTRRKQIAFNNAKPVTVVSKYSAKKVYGGSIMGNTRLEGDASSDPTEQFYFTIYNAPVDGSTAVGVSALVTIDYIAVWTEQKDVGGS